ncbi:hypothetical protein FRUB_10343 [Fimbriiglobus ruber]|uniref:Uncharacterized protein n=2 Tax=Fimbriiglobus ruber TaxID=1908690 RepID=A0A225CYQ3_9BACT|nr:hypothetical protein FRUB_10343 [Fimbriiglobus ruber]
MCGIVRQIESAGEWFEIANFTENQSRAYHYRARLKNAFPDGYDFTSAVKDGVGKLFCRRQEAKS